MKESFVNEIVEEICKEENIECKLLSKDYIMKLSKEEKDRFIVGNRFDLNSQTTAKILDDKYALYEVLKEQGVNIIEHNIIFSPDKMPGYVGEDGSFRKAYELFLKYNKNIVLKPNQGSLGKNIFKCSTNKELEIALMKLLKTNISISLCPFYNIKREYRVFYLNGQAKFVYGKVKPEIIGDGKLKVKELLEKFNSNMPDKDVYRENLEKLDLEYIPQKGEVISLSWKFNLSGGAQIIDVTGYEKVEDIKKLAIKAAKAVNLEFGSVDVIETEDGKLYIMEINSGVMMEQFQVLYNNGRNIAKEIYKEAINLMFNK